MRMWEQLLLGYLSYLLILAWTTSLPGGKKTIVTAVAVVDAAVIAWLSRRTGFFAIVRDWSPPVQILIAYWLSGLFFRAPMLNVEAWLSAGDRRLFSRLHL